MSSTPRLKGIDATKAPNLGSVLAHGGEVMDRFGEVYAEFWQGGSVSQSLKETTRLRNARITDCGF